MYTLLQCSTQSTAIATAQKNKTKIIKSHSFTNAVVHSDTED